MQKNYTNSYDIGHVLINVLFFFMWQEITLSICFERTIYAGYGRVKESIGFQKVEMLYRNGEQNNQSHRS